MGVDSSLCEHDGLAALGWYGIEAASGGSNGGEDDELSIRRIPRLRGSQGVRIVVR